MKSFRANNSVSWLKVTDVSGSVFLVSPGMSIINREALVICKHLILLTGQTISSAPVRVKVSGLTFPAVPYDRTEGNPCSGALPTLRNLRSVAELRFFTALTLVPEMKANE
jgi:hypothetical protein